MHFSHSTWTLLTLLVCRAIALLHDDHPTHAKLTKTIVVTITRTLVDGAPSSTPPTGPTLLCPTPGEQCTLEGISTWPSRTTSLVLPTVTFDPIEPSNATTTKTASTSCAHSMSQIIPGIGNSTSTPDLTLLTTIDEPIASETEGSSDPAASSTPIVENTEGENGEVKTSTLDPVVWAGMDGALMTKAKRSAEREQESGAEIQRRVFCARIFPHAHPTRAQIVRDEDEDEEYQRRTTEWNESECVECEKGMEIVCINGTHVGFCDEGCAEPRELREGTKCVDGKIFGA
jgi:hypothetical protein